MFHFATWKRQCLIQKPKFSKAATLPFQQTLWSLKSCVVKKFPAAVLNWISNLGFWHLFQQKLTFWLFWLFLAAENCHSEILRKPLMTVKHPKKKGWPVILHYQKAPPLYKVPVSLGMGDSYQHHHLAWAGAGEIDEGKGTTVWHCWQSHTAPWNSFSCAPTEPFYLLMKHFGNTCSCVFAARIHERGLPSCGSQLLCYSEQS